MQPVAVQPQLAHEVGYGKTVHFAKVNDKSMQGNSIWISKVDMPLLIRVLCTCIAEAHEPVL